METHGQGVMEDSLLILGVSSFPSVPRGPVMVTFGGLEVFNESCLLVQTHTRLPCARMHIRTHSETVLFPPPS